MELFMLVTGHGVIIDDDEDKSYIQPLSPEKADLMAQWYDGLVNQTEED